MRVDVGDPVAHRLVDGVLEGAAAAGDGDDLGAEQAHPGHVERLPPGVLLAHVDDALEPEQRARGGRGDAVLAGPGLGDDAGLAHPLGQQRLAEHVVDLVGPGVVEVLALEQDRGPAGLGPEARGQRERAGPAGVGALQPVELGGEGRIGLGRGVGRGQLVERLDECLGHEASAVGTEVTAVVGQGLLAGVGREGRGAQRSPLTCLSAGWVPAATRSATATRGSSPVTRVSPTSTASAPARA